MGLSIIYDFIPNAPPNALYNVHVTLLACYRNALKSGGDLRCQLVSPSPQSSEYLCSQSHFIITMQCIVKKKMDLIQSENKKPFQVRNTILIIKMFYTVASFY